MPWQDLFESGKGVDAVTGGVKPSAVNNFNLVPAQGKNNTSEKYTWVETESDLEQEIDASLSGSFNIYGVKTTASTEFMTKIKISDRQITYIAEFQVDECTYESADSSYSFTDQAKKLVKDPGKFRDQYGDYFIATLMGGSSFKAVYVCQASSKEKMDSFKGEISISKPVVFSADGASEFKKIANSHNISLSINIFMEGVNSSPEKITDITPEDANNQLNWFKKNCSIIPVKAELMHYSTIDSSIPRTINVDPDVFSDLSILYTKLWTIRDYYDNIPAYYSNIYLEDFKEFDSGVEANQSVLPNSPNLLSKYLGQADTLLKELTDIVERQDFYYEVKAQVTKEPNRNVEIKGNKSGEYWLYGFNKYNESDAVNISHDKQPYSIGWKSGHRDHSFSFKNPSNKSSILVGWSVQSNKNDNGSWKKTCDQVILENYATIYTRSEFDRGIDWTITWYYVDADDYRFE
ncbi:MAG: hypothetical protein D3925_01150 [Candidatus Electrothrix sp. AR5]|nr:hypothetical protein [Candidatus Electrothrix sp. AR5]